MPAPWTTPAKAGTFTPMSFTLTILGSGTSVGVPVIGIPHTPEFLANPKNHRTRASIHVATPAAQLVVDTGPEFRIQALRENLTWLDAVIITHAHADHIMGMDDLRRFCDLRAGRIPIHATETTLESIRRVFAYAFDGTPPRGYFAPDPRPITGPFEIGDLQITPFALPHGRIVTTGLVFHQNGRRRLAYFSDCREIPDEAIEAARNAPIAVLDALRRAPHPTHMCFDEAMTAARRIGAQNTYFTHLTHDYDHDVDQAELPAGVHLAYDGLKVHLPS